MGKRFSINVNGDSDDPPLSPRSAFRRELKEAKIPARPLQRPMKAASPSLGPPPSRARIGHVLGEPMITSIDDYYEIDKFVGYGIRADVCRCASKLTGERFACKSIEKARKFKRIRSELRALQHLSGMPNIVRLERAYEDRRHVHLVLELGFGGDLLQWVGKHGGLPEHVAREVFRQVARALHSCHMLGVAHGDVKLSNLVFLSGDPADRSVKLLDFGLSVFFKEYNGEYASVHKGFDVWCAGVVLYNLLSGERLMGSSQQVSEVALRAKIEEPGNTWAGGYDAKDLILKMVTRNPITICQVLGHPWIKGEGTVNLGVPAGFEFLMELRLIREMHILKRFALAIIVEGLSNEEIKRYKQTLQGLYDGEDPAITFEDFMTKLSVLGLELEDSEVKRLIDPSNVDRAGKVDAMEFIAAMTPVHQRESDENLRRAFRRIDRENNGFITGRDVEIAMAPYVFTRFRLIVNRDELEDEGIQEGKMNYEDFVAMLDVFFV